MKKIETETVDSGLLRALVFSEIESAILKGEFSIGDSLVEMKLSDQLGVSRTPVREALRQLELEGLVRTVPNKGAVVVGISEKDIRDIYDIRMRIEGLAARWAAEYITKEELDTLREVVELQEFYAAKGDAAQVWQLDSRFHTILYGATRSRPLMQTLSGFHHNIQKARELSFKREGRGRASVKEHRAILDAVAAGDGSAAEALAEEHIKNAKASVMVYTDSVLKS